MHGIKSNASRGAPTSSPSLPCFCESASGGNQIRHTVTSGIAPRYARYIANAEINGFWCARRTLPIYFSPSRLIRFFYSGIVSIPNRLSRSNSTFRTSRHIAPGLLARWRPRCAFRFPFRDSKRIGKFVVDAGARHEALDMYPRECWKPTDAAKSPDRFGRNARRICPANVTLPRYHQLICLTPGP